MNDTKKEAETVAVKTNSRTHSIIKNVIMPKAEEGDAFCISVMDACAAAGKRGLPINISIAGNDEHGRIAMVASSVCVMIVLELCDKEGNTFINGMANIILNDGVDQYEMGDDSKGARILKWSVPSELAMSMAGAMISSMAPGYVDGCSLSANRDIIHDEDDAPIGSDAPEEESNQIPFPSPSPRPVQVPTSEVEQEAAEV